MCRTIKIESSCPRCNETITKTKKVGRMGIAIVFGTRYPRPFKKINKTWLCENCQQEHKGMWTSFMNKTVNKKLPA